MKSFSNIYRYLSILLDIDAGGCDRRVATLLRPRQHDLVFHRITPPGNTLDKLDDRCDSVMNTAYAYHHMHIRLFADLIAVRIHFGSASAWFVLICPA